jgi:hypothetical protein
VAVHAAGRVRCLPVATVTNHPHGLNASTTVYSVRAVFTSTDANYDGNEGTNTSALTVLQKPVDESVRSERSSADLLLERDRARNGCTWASYW